MRRRTAPNLRDGQSSTMAASVWTLTAVSSMASMAVRGISLASSWIADRRIFDDGGIRLEPDRQSAAMAMRGTRTAQNLRRWNLDGCYDLESDRQSAAMAMRGTRTAPNLRDGQSSTMAASVWTLTAVSGQFRIFDDGGIRLDADRQSESSTNAVRVISKPSGIILDC